MKTLKLSEELIQQVEKDTGAFVGKIIDISEAPDSFSSHLNVELAKDLGVTKRDLSVQVAENRIRNLAAKADIQVICFFGEQIEKEAKLLDELSEGRILLIK